MALFRCVKNPLVLIETCSCVFEEKKGGKYFLSPTKKKKKLRKYSSFVELKKYEEILMLRKFHPSQPFIRRVTCNLSSCYRGPPVLVSLSLELGDFEISRMVCSSFTE